MNRKKGFEASRSRSQRASAPDRRATFGWMNSKRSKPWLRLKTVLSQEFSENPTVSQPASRKRSATVTN